MSATLGLVFATVAVATLAVGELRRGGAGPQMIEAGEAGPAVEVFQRPGGGGYGYRISVGGEVVIYQPHVPAVSGELGFASAEYARTVADLVVHRMRARILPPAISLQDLDTLGVGRQGRSRGGPPPAIRSGPTTTPATGRRKDGYGGRTSASISAHALSLHRRPSGPPPGLADAGRDGSGGLRWRCRGAYGSPFWE